MLKAWIVTLARVGWSLKSGLDGLNATVKTYCPAPDQGTRCSWMALAGLVILETSLGGRPTGLGGRAADPKHISEWSGHLDRRDSVGEMPEYR